MIEEEPLRLVVETLSPKEEISKAPRLRLILEANRRTVSLVYEALCEMHEITSVKTYDASGAELEDITPRPTRIDPLSTGDEHS